MKKDRKQKNKFWVKNSKCTEKNIDKLKEAVLGGYNKFDGMDELVLKSKERSLKKKICV